MTAAIDAAFFFSLFYLRPIFCVYKHGFAALAAEAGAASAEPNSFSISKMVVAEGFEPPTPAM